jgi:hypothetical protein
MSGVSIEGVVAPPERSFDFSPPEPERAVLALVSALSIVAATFGRGTNSGVGVEKPSARRGSLVEAKIVVSSFHAEPPRQSKGV